MHKIKAAARRSAWYGEVGDDTPNYNPFRKVHSKSRKPNTGDLEHQASPTTAPVLNGISENVSDSPSSSRGAGDVEKETVPNGRKESSQDSGAGTNDNLIGTDGVKKRKSGFRSKMHLTKSDGNGTALESSPSKSSQPTPKFTVANQIRGTIFNSWINILLIFVPVGIALNYAKIDPVVIFVINFIAIIPLAAMLSYATEEIALRTGETLGGLLNATFGNAVELIVSIIALSQNQILIVQTSLIGSMLSNLLLVMGMCFFFGGLKRIEQHFNVTVAQTASSLLALAIASLIIPTAFALWAPGGETATQGKVTDLSRGTSVLLLLVYAAYLYFQLGTHAKIYNEPSKKVAKRSSKHEEGDAKANIAAIGGNLTAVGGEAEQRPKTPDEAGDDAEEPKLHIWVAVATLAVSTVFVALCAEFMVDSIDALTDGGAISKTFVGLILLPIVGNAAEHATAVTVAVKDKMDLAIGVAVGSSMQIALLVLPLVVILGWILDKPDMDLSFDGFQIAVLFVAVLLVNYLIGDGKSHWLEGLLLQVLYLIIAIAAWYYPNPSNTDSGSS